jgi:hypothetical protein
MENKLKVGLIVLLILAAGGGLLFLLKGTKTPSPAPFTPVRTISPSLFPEPSPGISPTAMPLSPKNTPVIIPPPAVKSGITRGLITCDYQVPATPNEQGIAQINADWNYLVTGKNGKATASVCVSVNGETPSLMSIAYGTDNKTSVSAPWISLNADYNFLLYDRHGNDLPECGGIILSSCRINTN